MNKFLVTYDLVGTGESSADYKRLIEQIKRYDDWGKVQKSVWLIETWDGHADVRDTLSSYMDGDDRLMVIKVGGTAAWHNCLCTTDWLKAYLSR